MNKLEKLKSFFLVLENDCFQSHESHQLSAKIRISAHLFFHEKLVKPITIQEISYDRNDKVKMTVKDKIKKNSINIFKKEVPRPFKR